MIKKIVITHPVYAEWELLKEKGIKIRQMMGKYQFIYSSKKGQISMIELKNYLHDNHNFWEIFCLKGKLFEYEERYDTKQEADKRVRELLG